MMVVAAYLLGWSPLLVFGIYLWVECLCAR